MDGNINVYTVAYDDGVDDASVTNMPTNPQGYFFGSYTTAAAPSREGYDFQGWKAEGTDNVYEANQGFTLNGDVTLVAQWTLSNANVTFMIDGGTWTAPEAVKDTVQSYPFLQIAVETDRFWTIQSCFYIDNHSALYECPNTHHHT